MVEQYLLVSQQLSNSSFDAEASPTKYAAYNNFLEPFIRTGIWRDELTDQQRIGVHYLVDEFIEQVKYVYQDLTRNFYQKIIILQTDLKAWTNGHLQHPHLEMNLDDYNMATVKIGIMTLPQHGMFLSVWKPFEKKVPWFL